jgi:hypothetical protein
MTSTAVSSATTTVNSTINTATTSTQSTTSVFFGSCVSGNETESINNGDFSSGTYEGWSATGPGFGTDPFDIMSANNNTNVNYTGYYGVPWNNYDGEYMATTFKNGTTLQAGNLTSLPFQVSELYLNFKIISTQDSALYVEILKKGKPAIITHYNTYASPTGVQDPQSTFANASIPMGTLLCQNVSVKLVGGVTGSSVGGINYIAAGDFYLSKLPPFNPTIPVNQTFNS